MSRYPCYKENKTRPQCINDNVINPQNSFYFTKSNLISPITAVVITMQELANKIYFGSFHALGIRLRSRTDIICFKMIQPFNVDFYNSASALNRWMDTQIRVTVHYVLNIHSNQQKTSLGW